MKTKRFYTMFRLCVLLSLLLSPVMLYAQPLWIIFAKEVGKEMPVAYSYEFRMEKGDNEQDYYRVCSVERSAVPPYEKKSTILQYGFNFEGKKIVAYDFENKREVTAIDLDLKPGEKFTTINGMEWIVQEAVDSILSGSYNKPLRVLKVKTVDGERTDTWIEGFGSLSNHLMIRDMKDVEASICPYWLFGGLSHHAIECVEGPFISHYVRRNGNNNSNGLDANTKVTYENGKLVFNDKINLGYFDAICRVFYRVNDDIYLIGNCMLPPSYDNKSAECSDQMVVTGLPEPESGAYTLHVDDKDYTTGLQQVTAQPGKHAPTTLFDLQGRRLQAVPERGLFIQDGRKVAR